MNSSTIFMRRRRIQVPNIIFFSSTTEKALWARLTLFLMTAWCGQVPGRDLNEQAFVDTVRTLTRVALRDG